MILYLVACCPKNEIRTEQSPGSISIPIKGERWPEEKARTCYNQYDWLAGCNFISSTAINSLEFWQEDIFDPGTFSRELGWSANIVFNLHRVHLHNLFWEQDSLKFFKMPG